MAALPFLMQQGKITSSNALVVTGDTGSATASSASSVGNLPVVIDNSNRLSVRFI